MEKKLTDDADNDDVRRTNQYHKSSAARWHSRANHAVPVTHRLLHGVPIIRSFHSNLNIQLYINTSCTKTTKRETIAIYKQSSPTYTTLIDDAPHTLP